MLYNSTHKYCKELQKLVFSKVFGVLSYYLTKCSRKIFLYPHILCIQKQKIIVNKMDNNNTQHKSDVATKKLTDIQEPSFYNVVLNNDDYTPMDFVIQILADLFGKSHDEAYDIMMQVHLKNKGVAGCYPKEIATEKVSIVHDVAKSHNFPLTCHIEKA